MCIRYSNGKRSGRNIPCQEFNDLHLSQKERPQTPSPHTRPTTLELENTPHTRPTTLELENTPHTRPTTLELENTPHTRPTTLELENTPDTRPTTLELENTPTSFIVLSPQTPLPRLGDSCLNTKIGFSDNSCCRILLYLRCS